MIGDPARALRSLALALALVLAVALTPIGGAVRAQVTDPTDARAATVRLLYLGRADDPAYEPQRSYTGLSLRDVDRPVDGARLAMNGTRILRRALGLGFQMDEVLLPAHPLATGDPGNTPEFPDLLATLQEAAANGVTAVLLDLPEAEMKAAVDAGRDLPILFNIRHPDARWRGADCAANLLHTLPSRRMLSDAMAQYLRQRNWPKVLLLVGEDPADALQAAAIRASALKFGLKLVDERRFVLGHDPRQREANNIALLTGPPAHDVIWLADAAGEFGRYVPYASYLPRPVIGSEGLVARGWHWTWERHGAPQLNQRFRKLAGRDMSGADWAAWVAVVAVIEAARTTGAARPEGLADALLSNDLTLDLYKGVRGSFRPWNGQLRQPILLATHNATIARAPLEGFQHQRDQLDTLGLDQPESTCQRR